MTKKTKPVILIAGDEEILLRALYLLFHEKNYIIASATDGETALRMTERLKPDMVLLDLLLPKLSGFDYLKDIQTNPNLKDTPVIALSNLGDQADIDKTKALGALDCFIKANINFKDLAEKIEKILTKKYAKK